MEHPYRAEGVLEHKGVPMCLGITLVRDKGIGSAQEKAERIYERFISINPQLKYLKDVCGAAVTVSVRSVRFYPESSTEIERLLVFYFPEKMGEKYDWWCSWKGERRNNNPYTDEDISRLITLLRILQNVTDESDADRIMSDIKVLIVTLGIVANEEKANALIARDLSARRRVQS